MTSNNLKDKSKKNKKKENSLVGECSYHLCDKKNVPLYTCKYCKEKFCEEHLNPVPPGMPSFKRTFNNEYLEKWYRKSGHPCPPFLDHLKEEEKKHSEEYSRSLNSLLGTSSDYISKDSSSYYSSNSYKSPVSSKEKRFKKRSKSKKHSKNKKEETDKIKNKLFNTLKKESASERNYPNRNNHVLKNHSFEKSNTSSKKIKLRLDIFIFIFIVLLIFYFAYSIFFVQDKIDPFTSKLNASLLENKSYSQTNNVVNNVDFLALLYGEKNVKYSYVVDGLKYSLSIKVYSGIKDYFSSKEHYPYDYFLSDTNSEKFISSYLTDDVNRKSFQTLLSTIKNRSLFKLEGYDAKLVISLIQHIPLKNSSYDDVVLFPYETLYFKKGSSLEKSLLLSYLLKNLNYSTVLFFFEPEHFVAVGIECRKNYSYKNTGYCFVDVSKPSIISDDRITSSFSQPKIIKISDGKKLVRLTQEYNDVILLKDLLRKSSEKNGTLTTNEFNALKNIIKKYDLEI